MRFYFLLFGQRTKNRKLKVWGNFIFLLEIKVWMEWMWLHGSSLSVSVTFQGSTLKGNKSNLPWPRKVTVFRAAGSSHPCIAMVHRNLFFFLVYSPQIGGWHTSSTRYSNSKKQSCGLRAGKPEGWELTYLNSGYDNDSLGTLTIM